MSSNATGASAGGGAARQQKTATHQAAHSIRAKAASSSTAGGAGGSGGQDKGSKGRDAGLAGNSKVVYKALLESPLAVKWCVPASRELGARNEGLTSLSSAPPVSSRCARPSLPTHLQQTVVHTLCGLLAGVADYQLRLGRVTTGSKPVDKTKSRRRGDKPEHRPAVDLSAKTATERKQTFVQNHPRPPVLAHFVLGINDITKQLSVPGAASSSRAAAAQGGAEGDDAPAAPAAPAPPATPFKYIFVCLADLNPTSLVAHLPATVAGWNGRAKAAGKADASGVRLVTLAKGAEALLAQAFGVRRAAVVGLKVRPPFGSKLLSLHCADPPALLPSDRCLARPSSSASWTRSCLRPSCRRSSSSTSSRRPSRPRSSPRAPPPPPCLHLPRSSRPTLARQQQLPSQRARHRPKHGRRRSRRRRRRRASALSRPCRSRWSRRPCRAT